MKRRIYVGAAPEPPQPRQAPAAPLTAVQRKRQRVRALLAEAAQVEFGDADKALRDALATVADARNNRQHD
jgi:hypothetical protein